MVVNDSRIRLIFCTVMLLHCGGVGPVREATLADYTLPCDKLPQASLPWCPPHHGAGPHSCVVCSETVTLTITFYGTLMVTPMVTLAGSMAIVTEHHSAVATLTITLSQNGSWLSVRISLRTCG